MEVLVHFVLSCDETLNKFGSIYEIQSKSRVYSWANVYL